MESGSVPEVPGDDQHDRKVFREPRQVLGGDSWAKGRGQTSPLRGCAPPHLFPRDQGVWGAPSRVPTSWLGGQVTQGGDPICPGRPPLGETLGRLPLPLPLYIMVVLGLHNTRVSLSQGAALPLSLLVSRSAWRSPAGVPRSSTTTTPSCCCWTESSPTSPSLLAGSRCGRRHRDVRVLNAEAPLFGA